MDDTFNSILAVLVKADLGVAREYNEKVKTVINRLDSALSVDDVQTILYEEFHKWFAPLREGYAQPAKDTWSLLQKRQWGKA